MAVERQRFCPVCDRLFNEGEAVLRCTACTVLHHPGCWVRNNGCATDGPHEATPQPEAYGVHVVPRVPEPVAASAGPERPLQHSQPPVPIVRTERPTTPAPPTPARAIPSATDEFVIGRTNGGVRPARPAGDEIPPAPVLPLRPRARAGRFPDLTSSPTGKGMPSIYPGHRYLRFWYIPAAAAIAVLVATGVVFAADSLFGGDGDRPGASGDETPTHAAGMETTPTVGASDDDEPSPTAQSGVTIVPTVEGEAPAGASGDLAAGASAVVVNTGDCLNVRTGAGLVNDAIACIPDGTAVTILGGPTESDGLTWWQLDTPQGQGWAAADYLAVP